MKRLVPNSIPSVPPVLIGLFFAAASFAACGRSHLTPAPNPASVTFELFVHTLRIEDVGNSETGSPTRASFESDITYFGRFVDPGDPGSTDRIVYNDSIRFHSQQPYRLEAFMSIDTLYSRSGSSNTAVSSEVLGPSDTMLVCIFEGPALRIGFAGNGTVEPLEHRKDVCPGGIYRRLDLPRTLGVFLAGSASQHRSIQSRWEQTKDRPSFSGLDDLPRLRLEYRVFQVENGVCTVQVRCDTTLTGFAAGMANGEKVDVIADRVTVKGTLRMRQSSLWHEGEFRIDEELRFVRPALDTRVLTKSCVYELRLRRF